MRSYSLRVAQLPQADTVELGVGVRVCSGVWSGLDDRPAGPRGARAGRRGPRASATQAKRARAVDSGAGRGLRAHRDRARRLGTARLVPRAQGTHAAHRRTLYPVVTHQSSCLRKNE